MSFREILNKFCLVFNENKPKNIDGLPYNGFLGYSFIDRDFSLSFFVVALTYCYKGTYMVTHLIPKDETLIVRYEEIQPNLPIIIQKNKALDIVYDDIIKNLQKQYCVSKDIDECRQISDIDNLRKCTHPDLFKAFIFSSRGIFLENIEVLACKYLGFTEGQHYFVVQLLEEPCRDIDAHRGDFVLGVVANYGLYGYVLGIPVDDIDIKQFNKLLSDKNKLDDIAAKFKEM